MKIYLEKKRFILFYKVANILPFIIFEQEYA